MYIYSSYFSFNYSQQITRRSVFKCGRMDRICVCGMQSIVRKSCGSRCAIFVHMWVHAVYMRVHAVCMWINAVNMWIYVVYMRIHAVYNVIVKYFFIILYLKIIKIIYMRPYENPHIRYTVAFRIYEEIRI
jgi:hypothetical protein